MEPHTLDGRAALITGGARRLGAAIARALHDAGMQVAVHYHTSGAEAEALCAQLDAHRPGSASAHRADLRDTAGLETLVEDAAAAHGGLHVLVNNASSFYPTPLAEAGGEQWRDLTATNLEAPFFLARAAAPWLAASGGCIVNMADVYALRPRPGYAVYCAAKAGLVMLTEALALDLAPRVRVNAVAPGAVLPPPGMSRAEAGPVPLHTPLGRWGCEHEVAAAVVFLVRDATFTTGAVLPVDGGRRVSGY